MRSQVQILSPRFLPRSGKNQSRRAEKVVRRAGKTNRPISCGLLSTFYFLCADSLFARCGSPRLPLCRSQPCFASPTFDRATSLMAFSFEKLLVYQKAVDFADMICDQHRAIRAWLWVPRRSTQSRRALDLEQHRRGQRPLHQSQTGGTFSASHAARCRSAFPGSSWRVADD